MARFASAHLAALAASTLMGVGIASAPAPSGEQQVRSAQQGERQAPQQQRAQERAIKRSAADTDFPTEKLRKQGVPWWAVRHKSAGTRQNRRRRLERRTRGGGK